MTNSVAKKMAGQNAPTVPTTRDPFTALRDEMNDLISRIWHGNDWGPDGLALNPAMDVSEDENAYELRMDAPGMSADEFDIQIQGNTISVRGSRNEESEEKTKTFHRVERCSGNFSRTITLPCDINEDEVAAQYENGVLALTLPKSETSRVKKVDVKS